MIYQHEIPKGARLYFAKSAKLKRKIESIASEILTQNGFEEIVTPLFSYHQHEVFENETQLIRFGDEKNRLLTIRADSTVDVVRLITKRLGRSVEHRKWFYIQPVYRFPTYEYYQIGAEILEEKASEEVLKILIEFFHKLSLAPKLQISNMKIPEILAKEYGISYEILKDTNLDELLHSKFPWLQKLVYLYSKKDLLRIKDEVPKPIAIELTKMQELAEKISYENIIFAPLYYAKMRYYNDLFFRFFSDNQTLAMGGDYMSEGRDASGFAIYTDNVIALFKKVVDGS